MTWRMESENNVFRAMVIWLISLFLQNNQLRQLSLILNVLMVLVY